MRIAIIQFPGSNCERETMLAVKRAAMEPVEFLWNENPEKLADFAGFIIVGGFSYEDRSRAGIIAALDPILLALKKQNELGKPILGICNGAQILVEAGFVPGLENYKVGMALTENKRVANGKILGTGYYNAWAHLRLSHDYQRNAFTRYLKPNEIIRIPVAHAEGRFILPPALLEEVRVQGLTVLQYCDAVGQIHADFPINPNGSMDNIAAIANKQGNVLAIMPHPERTLAGDGLFKSMRDYIAQQHHVALAPLHYYPRPIKHVQYVKPAAANEWLVELNITDNQALTVQMTLRQLGFPVTVKRYLHWEIDVNDTSVLQQIECSEILFNVRKESHILPQKIAANAFLIRPKENILGQEKQQILQAIFHIQGINSIRQGVLWQFLGEDINIEQLLRTNIIHNPHAYECYHYPNPLS